MCTRVLYWLTILFPNVLSAGDTYPLTVPAVTHMYLCIVPANSIVPQRSQRRGHVYPHNVPGNTYVPAYCTR